MSCSSLNPCCNGRGSKTTTVRHLSPAGDSLNPCCNGRGSKTRSALTRALCEVLILVVMEEGQRLHRVAK